MWEYIFYIWSVFLKEQHHNTLYFSLLDKKWGCCFRKKTLKKIASIRCSSVGTVKVSYNFNGLKGPLTHQKMLSNIAINHNSSSCWQNNSKYNLDSSIICFSLLITNNSDKHLSIQEFLCICLYWNYNFLYFDLRKCKVFVSFILKIQYGMDDCYYTTPGLCSAAKQTVGVQWPAFLL